MAALQAGLGSHAARPRGSVAAVRDDSRTHAHAHTAAPTQLVSGIASLTTHLGYSGAQWQFPRSAAFDEQRVLAALRRGIGSPPPVRLKAVLRVAEDRWLLLQHHGAAVTAREISWRRDSRIEVLYPVDVAVDWAAWDAIWGECQESTP